jgi:hypothetical protein
MEKPMRTGPPCGARAAAAVDVSCGAFTQDAAINMQAALSTTPDTLLIVRSFTGW